MQTVIPENITGEFVEIRFVPLSEIEKLDGILWEKNSKKHDIDKILESIDRYGWVDPPKIDINLNGGKGGIVFGNGRTEALITGLIAAREAGREPPRGIPIDKTTGEWCIPIKFGVDCKSEVEAMALAIDHNNLQMSGFEVSEISRLWEAEGYLAVLSEIADAGVVPVTVDEEAIADMLLAIGEESEPELGEDDLDAVLDAAEADDYEIRVKAGEIWKLGNHLLACGDCTIAGNVERLFDGRKFNLLLTDPPYGVSRISGSTDPRASTHKSGGKILNDDLVDDKLRDFLLACFESIDRQMAEGAAYYISYSDIFAYEFIGAIRDVGWRQARPPTIIWVKSHFVFGQGDYHARHEPILYGWKPGAGHIAVADRTQDTIWEYDKPSNEKDVHPSVKPVELYSRCMINSSAPGDIICDPFLGSGTTIIAAEKMGDRMIIGFELSEHYCSIILDRWEALTGQTAQLVGNL